MDMKEFAGLFSRQVTASRKPVKRTDEATKPSKVQPAKILDSKRSKTVGILEKSLRVDFCEVENAVYNLDTSVINLEALQQIYEIVGIRDFKKIAIRVSSKRGYTNYNLKNFFLLNLSAAEADEERIGGYKSFRGGESRRSPRSTGDIPQEAGRYQSLLGEDSVFDVPSRVPGRDLERLVEIDESAQHLRLLEKL